MAVKEFHTTRFLYAPSTTIDQAVIAEDRAWETYQKASREARVMIQLRHPNIVNLIGVTLQPLRLLVELAPMGDIKHCIAKFQKASVRLRRTTLKETLLQVKSNSPNQNPYTPRLIASSPHPLNNKSPDQRSLPSANY